MILVSVVVSDSLAGWGNEGGDWAGSSSALGTVPSPLDAFARTCDEPLVEEDGGGPGRIGSRAESNDLLLAFGLD